MSSRVRLLLVAAASLGLMAAVVPITSAAVSYRFDLVIGERCFSGQGVASPTLTLTLRAPGGTIRSQVTTAMDIQQKFQACFTKTVRSGDTVEASNGTAQYSVVVPVLIAVVDRVFDTVSGTTRPHATLDIRLYACVFDTCPTPPTKLQSTANGQGHYSLDSTSTRPLRGGDEAFVVESLGFDTFARLVIVPFMSAHIGDQFVGGSLPTGSTAIIRLLTKTGTARAKAAVKGDVNARFTGQLKNGPSPVNVAKGNILKGSFATDASLTVPKLHIVGASGSQIITGTCLPHGPFSLQRNQESPRTGTAGDIGQISVDYGSPMASSDLLELLCATPKGDRIGVRSEVS